MEQLTNFVDFEKYRSDLPKMIMLIGIPGSGKSTLASAIAQQYQMTIFSSYAKRKELYGDESIQGDPQEVFTNLHKDILRALWEGKNIIYDATNIRAKNRMAFINYLNNSQVECYKIAYVVPKPFEDCLVADALRERKVGNEVISRMVSSFEFPQYFEGWNAILIYGAERALPSCLFPSSVEATIYQNMNKFDQKNPYYVEFLGAHSQRVRDKVVEFWDGRESFNLRAIATAAKYHDVGKLFTQTFDEQGIAHYYNHANWGTYYLLNNLELLSDYYGECTLEDVYFILFLVNYHMKPFQWTTDKAQAKWKKIFTNWYEALMLLHKADVLACEEAIKEAMKV